MKKSSGGLSAGAAYLQGVSSKTNYRGGELIWSFQKCAPSTEFKPNFTGLPVSQGFEFTIILHPLIKVISLQMMDIDIYG